MTGKKLVTATTTTKMSATGKFLQSQRMCILHKDSSRAHNIQPILESYVHPHYCPTLHKIDCKSYDNACSPAGLTCRPPDRYMRLKYNAQLCSFTRQAVSLRYAMRTEHLVLPLVQPIVPQVVIFIFPFLLVFFVFVFVVLLTAKNPRPAWRHKTAS